MSFGVSSGALLNPYVPKFKCMAIMSDCKYGLYSSLFYQCTLLSCEVVMRLDLIDIIICKSNANASLVIIASCFYVYCYRSAPLF